MAEPKAHPDLPNPATHGEGEPSRTPEGGKPTGLPTSERQDTETAHQGQHETRPGSPSGD